MESKIFIYRYYGVSCTECGWDSGYYHGFERDAQECGDEHKCP